MRSERIPIGLLILASILDWTFLAWAVQAPGLGGLELGLLLAQGAGLLLCVWLGLASLRARPSAEPRRLEAIAAMLGELSKG